MKPLVYQPDITKCPNCGMICVHWHPDQKGKHNPDYWTGKCCFCNKVNP